MKILESGPCHFCRRAMNWIASDAECIPVCRYCLGYLATLAKSAPRYMVALALRADMLALSRGDSPVYLRRAA